MKKTKQKNNGFTLVEMLIAVAVLTLAVAGPLTLVSNGILHARYAKDQITAIYLAQEAVEVVRNIRDSNVLDKKPWLQGISSCGDINCGINIVGSPPTLRVKTCAALKDCLLYYNNSTGLYNHETVGTTPTPFTRTFQLVKIVNAEEARLTVTVKWQTNPTLPLRTFTVTEELFNWQ